MCAQSQPKLLPQSPPPPQPELLGDGRGLVNCVAIDQFLGVYKLSAASEGISTSLDLVIGITQFIVE